jgi:diguanylate cyclase (GGDEF)-like protein
MTERYILLEDATNTAVTHTLFERNSPDGLPVHSVTLPSLGGRFLRVTVNADSDFESFRSTTLPWVAVAVGLGIVLVVYSFLLMIQRRSLVVEQQVATRTAQLQLANAKLEKLTMTDPLTGLANRRALDNFLENEWARASRDELILTVAMIDVDYFKKVNDQYGHDIGDECLKALAREMKHFFSRAGDLLARFGGEEFAIVMPNTDAGVFRRINDFRAHLATVPVPLPEGGELKMTLSAGLASVLPRPGIEVADLLRAADEALYEAKSAGRNQVRQVKNLMPKGSQGDAD